jgi:Tol biopolymer transport system component
LWLARLGPNGPAGPLVQRTFESTSASFASWSPDASWLAYQCGRGGDTQICAVEADGKAPARQLTTGAGTNFIGEWIDGENVLFAGRHGALWNVGRVSRTTGTMRPLTTFAEPRFYVRYPRWDGARRRVLFERFEVTGRVWAVHLPALTAAEAPAPGSAH